jgi:hypothetical protein
MSIQESVTSRTLQPPCLRMVAALVAAAAFGCAHQPPVGSEASSERPQTSAQHVAAGCLAVCPEATYVEVSPKGDLCRCWAPNAFQYTFAFPDSSDKLDYSRTRWSTGLQNVRSCAKNGKAWEPSDNRDRIVCLDPSAPLPAASEPSVAGNTAPPRRLPESVF